MNKNLSLVLGGVFLMILGSSFACATNVAYVVKYDPSSVDSVLTGLLEEMGLTYEVIDQTEFNEINFGEYDFILVGNENFLKPQEIPINEYPSIIVNGENMDDWGWTTGATKSKQSNPFEATKLVDNTITSGLLDRFFVYTSKKASIFYLDDEQIFSGLEIVVSRDNNGNSGDGIVVVAPKGVTLDHWTVNPKKVRADGVFIGITDTEYWTDETKTIFKNSIKWLREDRSVSESISLEKGINLVSFPLELDNSEVSNLGLGISWVKRFDGNSFVNTNTIKSGEGYLINSSNGDDATISGVKIEGESRVLKKGMNLVGVSSPNSVSINTLPSAVTEVSRLNSEGRFETATRYFGLWYNSFSLEPGRGYWMKVNSETVWDY